MKNQTKTIKKNPALMIGLAVFALTLITLCLLSSTWAKYIDTRTGTDTARVAKFDFDLKNGSDNITTNTDLKLFKTAYQGVGANAAKNTVYNATDKLIAPGTAGSFALTLTNRSEVSISVEFAITLAGTGATDIPVVFTYDGSNYTNVNYGTKTVGGQTMAGDLTALATAINNNIVIHPEDGTQTLTVTIGWFWAFEPTQGATEYQTNEMDTLIGKAGTDTLTVNVACTVAQVD